MLKKQQQRQHMVLNNQRGVEVQFYTYFVYMAGNKCLAFATIVTVVWTPLTFVQHSSV